MSRDMENKDSLMSKDYAKTLVRFCIKRAKDENRPIKERIDFLLESLLIRKKYKI